MSFRMAKIAEEDPSLNHKQRFTQAASEWKALADNAENKASLLAEAKEWKARQPPK